MFEILPKLRLAFTSSKGEKDERNANRAERITFSYWSETLMLFVNMFIYPATPGKLRFACCLRSPGSLSQG